MDFTYSQIFIGGRNFRDFPMGLNIYKKTDFKISSILNQFSWLQKFSKNLDFGVILSVSLACMFRSLVDYVSFIQAISKFIRSPPLGAFKGLFLVEYLSLYVSYYLGYPKPFQDFSSLFLQSLELISITKFIYLAKVLG